MWLTALFKKHCTTLDIVKDVEALGNNKWQVVTKWYNDLSEHSVLCEEKGKALKRSLTNYLRYGNQLGISVLHRL